MDKKTIKIIIISTLMTYIACFDSSSIAIVLPQLSSVLDISSFLANWISISLLLFCTASGLTFGAIVPKIGIMKVAKISIVVMIICGLLSTLIMNPWVIIFTKSIQGLSIAVLFFIPYLFIIKNIDRKEVGTALGIMTAGGFLSSISTPIISGFLSYYFPPQIIFSFTIPLLIFCLILLFTIDIEWKEDVSIDIIGTVFWFITMILFIYGISYLKTTIGLICFIISIMFLVIFVIYELNIENPLYNFRLLKNKVYAINNYAAMMACLVKDGMIFVLALYLQHAKNLSPIETGLSISILSIIMFVISPLAGKLSDTLDSVKLANFGAFLIIVSSILIALVRYLPTWSILASIIFLGLGYGLFDTPNKKIILYSAKDSELSYVTAFLSTIKGFGRLVSTALFTLSLSLFSGIRYGPKYWGTSSQLMFNLFLIGTISILVLSIYANRNIKVVYKIDFTRFTQPITNKIDSFIGTVSEVSEEVIDTVSEVPGTVI
ncbi:MAG: MFS transporter, partial [archaeon]|nr:MFS transporter [archaeon]